MLGPLCNQTVNLETDAKTLHYSLLKLKYSPSIYLLKHKKRPNLYITATEITRTQYSTKKSSNQSFVLCIFGDFYASRMQDAEVTKSLWQ